MTKYMQRNIGFFGRRLFVGAVVIATCVAVGYGFSIAGSPSNAREQKADQRRIQDLYDLANGVFNYVNTFGNVGLPSNLMAASISANSIKPSLPLKDPETGRDYDYLITSSTTYQLCAVFGTSFTSETPVPSPNSYIQPIGSAFWDHPGGKKCFSFIAKPIKSIQNVPSPNPTSPPTK